MTKIVATMAPEPSPDETRTAYRTFHFGPWRLNITVRLWNEDRRHADFWQRQALLRVAYREANPLKRKGRKP